MQRCVFLVVGLLTACAGRAPRPEEALAPPIDRRAQSTSEVIEVRRMVLGWEGLEGSTATRSEEDARARADVVSGLLRTPGTSFGVTAREYSDSPLAVLRLRRGDESQPVEVVEASFRLAIGDVSGPIRTPQGFVILERLADPSTALTSVHARHILIAFVGSGAANDETTRTREEALSLATDIARRARDGEDWDALHEANSNEEGGPPGGDLGTFERGMMVPAFERVAFRLDVREISEPVETQFGYHVIQRLE